MSQTNWGYVTRTYLYLLRGLKNTADDYSNKAAKYNVINATTQIVIIVFSSISSALLSSSDNNTDVIRYVLLILTTTIAILSSVQALFKFPKRQLVYSKSSLAHEQLSNAVSIEISKPKKLRYKPHEFTNFVLMRKMAIKRRLVNALNDETDKEKENEMTLTPDIKQTSTGSDDSYNTHNNIVNIKTPEQKHDSDEWKQLTSEEIKERERILLNGSESEEIGSEEDIEIGIDDKNYNKLEIQDELETIIKVHEETNKTGATKFNEVAIEKCMNDYENTNVVFDTNL